MYRYHNELRNPNGGGAPWWSWPFDLKPIWGYFWTYGDGSQALTFMAGNPVLFWLSVPAVAFGAWQAWRRRSTALAFVLIVFFALWLPWARIDRVAYQYHYYTPLPFAFLLLAYFLAELWSGPSRRAWTLARVAFAAVLIAPAGLWVFRDQACAIAGTRSVNATAAVCNTAFGSIALPVGLWLIAAAIAGWFVLGAGNPRRLVAVIIGAAAAAFLFLYPMVSAWPLPNGWPLIYQGLLPTWDGSFSFASNNQPVASVQILSLGLVAVVALTVAVTWAAMRAVWSRRPADA